MQKMLVTWWPLITTFAWAVILGSLFFIGSIMKDLSNSMNTLASQLNSVKQFSLLIENNLRQMQTSVKETEIHLQAHGQRMEVIEKRLNHLETSRKEGGGKKPLKSNEHVLLREYVLVEPEPTKAAPTR